jgi:hypothetical protein
MNDQFIPVMLMLAMIFLPVFLPGKMYVNGLNLEDEVLK